MSVLSENLMNNPSGVGSHLAKMFSWFLIRSRPDCPCHEHAREYDSWGADLCLKNMDIILDRLEEQAITRRLPFSRFVARRLVMIAINKARRGKPL